MCVHVWGVSMCVHLCGVCVYACVCTCVGYACVCTYVKCTSLYLFVYIWCVCTCGGMHVFVNVVVHVCEACIHIESRGWCHWASSSVTSFYLYILLFFLGYFKIYFYLCTDCMPFMRAPEYSFRSMRTGVTDGNEMSAGNQTWILWKNSKCSWLLNHLSNLSPNPPHSYNVYQDTTSLTQTVALWLLRVVG